MTPAPFSDSFPPNSPAFGDVIGTTLLCLFSAHVTKIVNKYKMVLLGGPEE